MSEVWKKWEGQVADHKYLLQQYLGSTDHSVVFLAEYHDLEPRQTAVKFISADLVNAEQQLAAWNSAAQLSHPNLLRIYGSGRCKIEDMELLYVAMEYAEENLGQVLPQRALLAEETRDTLNAVVDVFVYLHAKNLAHGHIKPSNVLAIGDLLKLSADTILPAGTVREMRRERSAYDAPELPDSPYTPAADVWSLGVTLVEAFTQQPAILPFDEQADPVIPSAMRDPFLEITRHALRRDPKLRWSSAQIAERLNPAAIAAKAATAVAVAASPVASAPPLAVAPHQTRAPISPLSVPLSKEPAIPLSQLPHPLAAHSTVSPPPDRIAPRPPRETVVLPNYVIPLFAGILTLIAIIALPKVLRHREASVVNAPATSVYSTPVSVPNDRATSSPSRVETPSKQPALAPAKPAPVAPTPSPAVLRSKETTLSPSPKISNAKPGRGEPLDQVLPEVPAKAMSTIQGTVRVVVKIHADAAGNVTEAELDTPGPSKYFAELALKAARRWAFSSPEVDGHSAASDWLIQFGFSQDGVKASATQIQP